jgi:RNA polymerase sigma factor (TIGR02999 family)
MTSQNADKTTALLKLAAAGDRASFDELLPLVYDELRRLAAWKLRAERSNHTLQPTALVHEAYLRLINQHSANWQNRAHFLAIASEMMRRILVNHAESRNAQKRGEGLTLVPLDDAGHVAAEVSGGVDLLFLDAALNELAAFDPEAARIVELKFFGGLTNEETAEVLGVSESTVKRDWRTAKAWLAAKLT